MKTRCSISFRRRSLGFSLVEVMVAMMVLCIVLMICFGMLNETGKAWRASSARIEEFQAARTAFEKITRTLSIATLNTYYDYYDSGHARRQPTTAATFVPAFYGRQSELQFISGKNLVGAPRPQITHSVFFAAPLGYTRQPDDFSELGKLLNAMGFFIEFGSDEADRPDFITQLPNRPAARWRYRLLEFRQPSENLAIYKTTDHSWISDALASATPLTHVLAENIIACVILPKKPADNGSLAPDYEYDSRSEWTTGAQPDSMHQLPPLVHIVLIAASETSMARLQRSSDVPNLGFDYSSVFQKSANLEEDIATVSRALQEKRIHFRVFQTDIALRGARWSK